ncbi:MAG TPA: Holliday junction resolvase RecU [Candidatus Salinicoccus merdavium]|nr:Holliday junction resolvase RecU [Candidatus Salinicoccus merdavium]
MKYPKGIKPGKYFNSRKSKPDNRVKYGQRGMTLEKDLDITNNYYLQTSRAVIHKKPTPVQIVNVDYPSRNKAKIDEAYFKTPSTSDYNGIYKARYIDFEAKETKNKTRFPFINIHAHQVDHMKQCYEHGGVVFLIIRFSSFDETYLMPFGTFLIHWQNYLDGQRKSIAYDDIKSGSCILRQGMNPRIDYLAAVDEIFFGMENFNER